MARIKLAPDATTTLVMDTVRETFEARDYHWEHVDADSAIASEGGTPVRDAGLPLSRRLRVTITIHQRKHRLVLNQETIGAPFTGAAVAAGAGPWLHLKLGSRFGTIVKAVRDDLTAAALH